MAGLGTFAAIRTQLQLRQYELTVRQSFGARSIHLLQLTLIDSCIPFLSAILLLSTTYSLFPLSEHVGWSLPLATQLKISPWYAALALLTVLLLTSLIVVVCLRRLLKQPLLQTLVGTEAN